MDWITFNQDQDHNEVVVDARVLDFKRMNPVDAAVFTVQHIVERYPAPYTLMLSGGVDSQAMLYAWHLSGFEFSTRTVRYNTDLNAHDVGEIQILASQLNIELNYHDVDLLSFLENDYDAWANKYECASPQICTHMMMCSDLPGTAIFSGNFAAPNKLYLDHSICGMKRYAERSGQSVVPFFLLETPELAYSLMPIIIPIKYGEEGFNSKEYAYKQAGFPIVSTTKQTGFEQVKDLYDVSHKHLVTVKQRLAAAHKPSRRVFDLLLRYPYERKFGFPKYKFLMNPIQA